MRLCFDSFDALVPLADLRRSKHQRNKHPKEQIERLALIMKTHGVRHPISVSRLSGEVCFGHGRWEAARSLGWTEFPVVYQDFSSDAEEYACVQSDNAIASWAELDLPEIKLDLTEHFQGLDVSLLGMPDFTFDLPAFEPPADEPDEPKSMTMLECPHCAKLFEQGQAKRVEV